MRLLPKLLFILFLASSSARVAAESRVPENALLKPTFLRINGSWSGGSAFLARIADRGDALLITCHHLFGPATGLEQQMSSDDIARDVAGAVGLSMNDRRTIVVAPTYLKIANARPFDKTGAEADLAAFIVRDSEKLPSFSFAEHMPQKGETVFVYARPRNSDEAKLLPATVQEVEDKWLAYAYADKTLDMRGTSGAPVLDTEGRVVGMNLGGGEQNGQLVGIANPASAMRAAIQAASK
jgi:hypothetical protein